MSSSSPRPSTESFDFHSPNPSQAQFPFPHPNDLTIRPNSTGGRYQPRRGSTASSIHSVGGALDTAYKASMGSVTEQNRNAISTLLQPPILRTGMLPHTTATAMSSHRPPSTKDIPPVTLANIPHIEPSAFNPYLEQIGNLYEAFQRAKAETEEAVAVLGKGATKKDDFDEVLEHGLKAASSAGTPVLPSSGFSPAASPKPKRRISASKRTLPVVTPLSTIPNIYFDENFHLENPRTFDVVSERSEVVRPVRTPSTQDLNSANATFEPLQQPGRKVLATNAILQEKLSWYMDTVEVHLISSISTASTSFFAALGSLRELQGEASDSVARIKAVREDLTRLDEQMAIGGLKIIELKRRRENLRRLADATDQLQAVIVGLSHCDEVVDRGELDIAMTRLDAMEKLILGTLDTSDPAATLWLQTRCPPTLIDLRSLRALDGVAEGMQQLKFRIGRGFEARFLNTLLTDLRHHIKKVPSQDTLQRWVTASQRTRGDLRLKSSLPAYMMTSNDLRSRLRASLTGLSSASFTNQASATFRDAVVREMKMIIRKHLPSSSDDDAESMASVSTRGGRGYNQQDKNSVLSRNLKAMDPADADEFFTNIFTDIGEALRRLSMQVKVLLDVTSGVISSPPLSGGGWRSPPRSPFMGSIDAIGAGVNTPPPNDLQEELMQTLDMSSLLGQAVDAAQTQVTKLLKVRSEATTQLPLDRFLRYFNLCRLFADECEAVSGRSGVALKAMVNSHITDFVSKFGDIEKQELTKAMDSDRWEPKDFDEHDAEVLARILKGMTSDPTEWVQIGSVLGGAEDDATTNSTSQTNGTSTEKEMSKNPASAIVDEEKYIISNSSTFVLRGIERFEILLSVMPSMISEVSAALCEYIKLFNSRLCQLILGAGAIHSAGLKNINTKHLAIASQTLSFIIAILPYIRECARRHATGNKPALGEFDNVKRLLQDQQVSIHDKLIDIMSNRATSHVRKLKEVEWDNEQEVKKDVSPNMETLTKETVILHKVINKYLHEIQVRMIMTPVFDSYREQIGKVFKEANVKTGPGKQRYVYV
jgi:vacuolar protein sorting-associated protein 54